MLNAQIRDIIVINFLEDVLPNGDSTLSLMEDMAKKFYEALISHQKDPNKKLIHYLPKDYPVTNPRLQAFPYLDSKSYKVKEDDVELYTYGGGPLPSNRLQISFKYELEKGNSILVEFEDESEILFSDNVKLGTPEKEEYFAGAPLRAYNKGGYIYLRLETSSPQRARRRSSYKVDVSDKPGKFDIAYVYFSLNIENDENEMKQIDMDLGKTRSVYTALINFSLNRVDEGTYEFKSDYSCNLQMINEEGRIHGSDHFDQDHTRYGSASGLKFTPEEIRELMLKWLKNDQLDLDGLYGDLVGRG